MHHIVYQSSAVGEPTAASLRLLLQHSRIKNGRLNVTGLLLYGKGEFLQVLEGETDVVRALYETIKLDHRHKDVATLSDGIIPVRVFKDWTMGFQQLADEDFVRLVGYIDPYRPTFLAPHPADTDESMLWLLRSFVANQSSWV
ncbi:Sensors of blue-light using FAD [Hymenobacter daecheongensis DSM 21074]|uniref:Sensors of blue-light using FAD n=1 Tax=Hymenobacter daecheongensis DSM 21074 TaxID=1121955 RepID=A0A1M6I7B5_9BACT|nr:BLUF domain-containing protein [Hymenobacter daecheongensis]SHJ30312.1 Sensors of blue-light using FAD [Hymenobacter daecheongensis DSM 21074]